MGAQPSGRKSHSRPTARTSTSAPLLRRSNPFGGRARTCKFNRAVFGSSFPLRALDSPVDLFSPFLRNSKHSYICEPKLHSLRLAVERLWRSIKYEEVYLRAYDSISAARQGLGRYLTFYSHRTGRLTARRQNRCTATTWRHGSPPRSQNTARLHLRNGTFCPTGATSVLKCLSIVRGGEPDRIRTRNSFLIAKWTSRVRSSE